MLLYRTLDKTKNEPKPVRTQLVVTNVVVTSFQVHPYTFRNENCFLHFDFHQDPFKEYDYWINKIGVDGLFTDFTGSLHSFQEWTSPLSSQNKDGASKLVKKIASLIASFKRG